MITNTISPEGGLRENFAAAMGMKANLLPNLKLVDLTEKVDAAAGAGADNLVTSHMRNWMECICSRKQTNAPVEAG